MVAHLAGVPVEELALGLVPVATVAGAMLATSARVAWRRRARGGGQGRPAQDRIPSLDPPFSPQQGGPGDLR